MRISGLLASAALMLCASAAFAAGNVASLDYQRLLREAPQIKGSAALLKQEFSPQEKAIQQQRKRFRALRKRYLSLGPETNSLELASVDEELTNARKKLNNMEQQYATGLALRRRQLRADFSDLVDKEIKAYAKAHGFSLVLRGGVLYDNSATNITDAILARLKADYRQAQAEGKHKKP